MSPGERYAHHRDRDAERRVLGRHVHTPPLVAESERASLGDILDNMVHSQFVDPVEPLERRALSLVGEIVTALHFADGDYRELLYSLSKLADGFVEIGRRLEAAGPRRHNSEEVADVLGGVETAGGAP